MAEKKNDEDDEDEYRRYLGLVGIPFVIIVTPICGYFIGYGLDRFFGTAPYLSYVFLVLGLVACVREVYNILKTYGKDD